MRFNPLHLIKEYLAFSKNDRNAVITLAILIFAVITGHIVIDNISPGTYIQDPEIVSAMREFSGSVIDSNFSDEAYVNSDTNCLSGIARSDQNDGIDQRGVVSSFDPNSAGMDLLIKIGFNHFQASNLIKYREKGGCFYKKADLLKIYGVDSSFYTAIEDSIRIEDRDRYYAKSSYPLSDSIELNSADSADLIQLSGIGPVFAARIIKYRNILGGFYSTNQLLEVYNLPEATFNNIKRYIFCDTTRINLLRINFADYSELIRHPYLDRDEVQDIINFRDKYGPFALKEQLIIKNLVDSLNFKKIKHYITCR